MSIRKCAAAAAGLLAATTIAGVGLSTAGAAGNGGLPFITGGGHTQNNNSSAENPRELTNFGGFNAQATGAGEEGDGYTAYPARGEVQGRSADTITHATTGKVHGDVVCIADLGPADSETGGNQTAEGGHVWEIRFQIERSSPIPLEGGYASLFVQDNGPHEDYADESFESSLLGTEECGHVTEFQLEPHQGQITVHNG